MDEDLLDISKKLEELKELSRETSGIYEQVKIAR